MGRTTESWGAASARDGEPLTPGDRVAAWLMPTMGDTLFVCIFAYGLLVLQGNVLGIDGDAGWNIALGLLTLRHGLPRTEPFLSTMLGQPVVHWEWLAQVGYALGYLLGGLTGVVAVASLLMALAVRGLYAALRRRGLPALGAAGLALLGAMVMGLAWTARAELFSLLLTLWWTEWLWRYWHDGARWRLWLFPVVTALWVNLHAGFLGGFALLGAATTLAFVLPNSRRAARPVDMALTLVGCALATLVTPWGFDYWRHVITFARNPLVPLLTQEYQSPNFHLGQEQIFLALVIALVGTWLLAAWRMGGRGIEPLGLTLCALWTALAFVYVRFVPVWPLICLPCLAKTLVSVAGHRKETPPEWWEDWRGHLAVGLEAVGRRIARGSRRVDEIDGRLRGVLWAPVVVLLAAALMTNGGALPGQSRPLINARWNATILPVAAVAVLRRDGIPPGRGFNPYEWGGYLDQSLPGYHVFIDSRSDVYSSQFLRDYETITELDPRWSSLLDHYAIQWALIQANSPLRQALALSGWQCRAEGNDGVAVLCVRPPATLSPGTRMVRTQETRVSTASIRAGRASDCYLAFTASGCAQRPGPEIVTAGLSERETHRVDIEKVGLQDVLV